MDKMSLKRIIKEEVRKMISEKGKYQLYHDSFTSAAETALDYAESQGYEVDEQDWQREVALGGGGSTSGRARPSKGKTSRFTVGLIKNGKPQRKNLNFQVYGMDSGKYELNVYIN